MSENGSSERHAGARQFTLDIDAATRPARKPQPDTAAITREDAMTARELSRMPGRRRAGKGTRTSRPVRRVSLAESPLLTPAQVGSLLGIPAKTVVQYAREGRLPAKKIGRYWRFVLTAVEDALADDDRI